MIVSAVDAHAVLIREFRVSVPDFVSAALSHSIELAIENVALGGGPFGAVITSLTELSQRVLTVSPRI